MDHTSALFVPASPDRRTIARFILAGAGVAALGEAGTMTMPLPRLSSDEAFAKAVADIAHTFDTDGPAKAAQATAQLEVGVPQLIKKGVLRRTPNLQATYGQLLVITSIAADDLGDYNTAGNAARTSASIATEIGDKETEAQAFTCLAQVQRNMGRMRSALSSARKAYEAGKRRPSGVRALLQEAFVAAQIGNRHLVFDCIAQAERAYEYLPRSDHGRPGLIGLDTLHPSRVKLSAGGALAGAGLYTEAEPRLAEAAATLADTDGSELSDVWLEQALVCIGTGRLDEAVALATDAVAAESSRPSTWVASRIADLDKRTRDPRKAVGPFTELVEQTRKWGLPIRPV